MKLKFSQILMGAAFTALALIVFQSAARPTALAAPDVIWSDDFETSNFSQWTSNDPEWVNSTVGTEHSGTRKARIEGEATDSNLYKEVSTAGFENISLSFWYDIQSGWDAGDTVAVEWTADGGIWNTLETLDEGDKTPLETDGDQWVMKQYSLPASAADNPTFAFRFRANLDPDSGSTDVFDLDDVMLKGDPIGDEEPTPVPTDEPEPTVPPSPTDAPTPTSEPSPTGVPEPDPDPELTTIWDMFRAYIQMAFAFMRDMFGLYWGW